MYRRTRKNVGMIKKLQDLIRISSYSGKEEKIQKYIKKSLESTGLKPFFQDKNVILHLQGKDSTKAFIFNGHVDVVSIGDSSKWKYPAFSGHIANGKIYGRGTSDMKSGILTMMVVAEILNGKVDLPTDVWFTFVVNEETDGSGTKNFVEWFKASGNLEKYNETAAIFAEPTLLKTAHYGHRGNYFLKAKIDGSSGHSGRPKYIKIQAIKQMIQFLLALEKESIQWEKRFKSGKFLPPSITVTSFQSISDSPNKIADYCEAIIDLRTIPGFHEDAYEAVERIAKKLGISLFYLYPPNPIGFSDSGSKIIKSLKKSFPKIKLDVNQASNDLGFFNSVGIDGIIFGPGDMKQAHRTNEYALITQIKSAPQAFLKVYYTWSSS